MEESPGAQLSLEELFAQPLSKDVGGESGIIEAAQDGRCVDGDSRADQASGSASGFQAPKALPSQPMLRSYLELKQRYPEHVLLYQVGDFYEVFFDDARRASQVLNIRLTSRNKDEPDPVPMCGVPIHAIENYLPRLLEAGLSCVLVSQLEEDSGKKGVRREISRIVTPGVRYEGDGLDERRFNYLAACCLSPRGTGALCYADVSTGHLHVADLESFEELLEALEAVKPAEVILPTTLFSVPVDRSQGWFRELKRELSRFAPQLVLRPFAKASAGEIERRLKTLFGGAHEGAQFSALGDFSRELLAVLETALNYIDEVSFGRAPRFSQFRQEERAKRVFIDAATRRNLELTESRVDGGRKNSLLAHIDYTRTAGGSRLLARWIVSPSLDPAEIEERHDAVQELLSAGGTLEQLRESFAGVRDLDRLVSRITSQRATPPDFGALKESIQVLPRLHQSLGSLKAAIFCRQFATLDPLSDVSARLEAALSEKLPAKANDGGIFKETYHEEIARLRSIRNDGREWLSALEEKERSDTGISGLKVRYNNVFGYYIEVSKAQLQKVPERYERRQTLTNAERFVTRELKDFEHAVLSAKSRQIELERELFTELRNWVSGEAGRIQQSAVLISTLDALCSLAVLARDHGYCRPRLVRHGELNVSLGRHPVVERVLGQHNFVPNDVRLNSDGRRFAVLTGPNMGGKSTYLRQIGLIQLLAQAGSFVPAKSADLPLVDRIFTRIGASDDLARGDSTFMVEMREAASIIRKATDQSLVLIDEIGRGTATTDGLALATAIAEWLHDRTRCVTVFATHFHELTELSELKEGIFCLAVGIVEEQEEIVFTHRIEEHAADRSYGIEVARLAGLPEVLLERARGLMHELGRSGSERKLPESLEKPLPPPAPAPDLKLEKLARRISDYNLNSMTPLEALVELAKLKELL